MPPHLPSDRESHINLNTVLLTIVLALGGWTLNRTAALSEQMSAASERDSALATTMTDIRARLVLAETQIQDIRLEIAAIKK